MMTGWSFFFTLMGVATLAAQVFRVVDYIERPAQHPRRSAARYVMDVLSKLEILTDAAKYDAACTSSGVRRGFRQGYIGNTTSSIAGCCHTFSADGRCVTLLKVLMSNCCVYDCAYCVNRRSNETRRASFTPEELADLTIYVIDVAEGEKIPRKGGPGITKSDFLVINKTDLAPYVGASLEVMASDTQRMRGDRPWTFTNLKQGDGLSTIIAFLEDKGMLGK